MTSGVNEFASAHEVIISSIRLLRILPACILMSTACGESSFNPWSLRVTLEASKGENIITALDQLRVVSSKKLGNLVFGDTYHQSATIRIDDGQPNLKSLAFSEDRVYEGTFGEVFYRVLSDYGCGFSLRENEAGSTYVITISTSDPTREISVFIAMPKAWRRELRDTELRDFLHTRGIETQNLSELHLSKDGLMIMASGRSGACRQLFFLGELATRSQDGGRDSK